MYNWVRVIFIMAIISVAPPLLNVKIVINNIIPIILYATCVVLFFIGKRRLLSVDLSKIKHPFYLRTLRESLSKVKDAFVWLFVFITICFAIDQCLNKFNLSTPFFDFRIFVVLTLLEAIAYYDCNCRGIRRLKDEINHI